MNRRVLLCIILLLGMSLARPYQSKSEPQSLEFVNKPWTGDFDQMVARRHLRVLVVPSKTSFFAQNGLPKGVTFELFNEFEATLNKELKKGKQRIDFVYLPTSRDKIIPSLLDGKGDIAAAEFTITSSREKDVDFSRRLLHDVNEVVITGPSSPQVLTIDDLPGKEVFVRKSSSYWEHLSKLNKMLESENKLKITLTPAPEELEDEDLLEMLNAGLVPLCIVDEFKASLWANVFKKITVHKNIVINGGGEIAWMFRKDSPLLKAKIDNFVKDHAEGTVFGKTLWRRYIGSTKFIANVDDEVERRKFLALVSLFEKYAEQYDVDSLLMVAQGYQESRLNQKVRSRAGAIGIMQLMPKTGKEMNVGNIFQVEANIHAGIKYMRILQDRYFAEEPMDKLNKMLFTFAAYNAGPAKVARLRKEAAERGFDPDVWFKNVEIIASERIGSETVKYVSNIFKYSIAYQLIIKREAERQKEKKVLESQTKA